MKRSKKRTQRFEISSMHAIFSPLTVIRGNADFYRANTSNNGISKDLEQASIRLNDYFNNFINIPTYDHDITIYQLNKQPSIEHTLYSKYNLFF